MGEGILHARCSTQKALLWAASAFGRLPPPALCASSPGVCTADQALQGQLRRREQNGACRRVWGSCSGGWACVLGGIYAEGLAWLGFSRGLGPEYTQVRALWAAVVLGFPEGDFFLVLEVVSRLNVSKPWWCSVVPVCCLFQCACKLVEGKPEAPGTAASLAAVTNLRN